MFTAKSAYSFSPYYVVDTEHALEQTFFRQQSILYSSEKMNPKPLSPAGQHKWPFQFRFPANGKALPPSFGHIADSSQTISVGYSSRNVRPTCYALYSLTAHLRGTDLPKSCPTATEERYVFFWPNRLTELPDGPWPKEHRHNISIPRAAPRIPFQQDNNTLLKRLRKKVVRTQDFALWDLVAHVPRYAILGQPLQVDLSITPGDDMPEHPVVVLDSVKYALHANTRVGRRSSGRRHVFSHVFLTRHSENVGASFPEADNFIHLHTTAPVILPTRASWSQSHKDAEMMGPLCPTFETELVARSYTLTLYVTVSCNGKLQARRYEGGEIVLLPPRLDASVKQESLTDWVKETS